MNRPTGPRIPLRPRGPRIRAVGNVRDGVAMGDMHVQGGQPFVPASPEALRRYRAWIAENNLGIHADDVSLQTMKINGKRAQDFEP